MSTRYPEIFEALASPFNEGEVKVRTQAGRQLHYITARTAMNRLDVVLGPENWWDRPTMLCENSFLCELTIRLPDGSTVTKADVGGMAGMSDAGDDDKSGASDAFKRAAVKFGVARYLYRDGVPSYAPAPAEDFPRKVEAPPETWSKWIGQRLRKANADWLREMEREGVEPHVRQDHRELSNEWREVNQLVTKLIHLGKIPPEAVVKPGKPGKPDIRDPKRARDAVVLFFDRSPRSIKRGVEKHLAKRLNEKRAELGISDPDVHDAADADAEKAGAAPPAEAPAPQSGRALFAWLKEQEQRHEVGVLKYIIGWAKLQEFPARMPDWDAEQLAMAHAEACRKLRAHEDDRARAASYEEALSN